MRIKPFGFLTLFLMVMMTTAPGARGYTIELDGIANAVWWEKYLTDTYLNIADADSGIYYYQWTATSGGLPWSDLPALVNDLTDNNRLDSAGGIPVGDWRIESGGDVFNDPSAEIRKSLGVTLSPGWYELRLTPDSEAYNLNDYIWPNESENPLWNAYVQIWADYGGLGESFAFGDWSFWQDTEEAALDYYRNCVDGVTIYLAQSADLYFYINDFNSVDNAGSVTLDIQVVPEPGTLCLLGLGLAFLIGTRRWRKKEAGAAQNQDYAVSYGN
jgi:hypothetical protein